MAPSLHAAAEKRKSQLGTLETTAEVAVAVLRGVPGKSSNRPTTVGFDKAQERQSGWNIYEPKTVSLLDPMHKRCSRHMNDRSREIYAVGGGKGGTGKSFVTANLGVLLAQQGKKVLLVDLDLGASNLHTFLTVKKPQVGLREYLSKEVVDLNDTAIPTVEPNLSLISSIGCSLEIANLYYAQKIKIIKAIRNLPYDFILLDLGSGTHFNTIDFFLIDNQGFLVTTPEPSSIENMFRFIKSIYLRKLRNTIKEHGFRTIFHEAINTYRDLEITTTTDLLRLFKDHDSNMGEEIEKKVADFNFMIILNHFRNQIDVNFGSQIAKVCNRHLYFNYEFIDNVTFDSRVSDSILNNQVFVRKYGYTKTALELKRIARKVMENSTEPINSLSLAS
ncbi:MAG: AAA family ATPase [Deltaproteobacteria bacterium]|nr:MAG: AAA family ATPase [Deltaproteobacteria bacterium]